MTWSLEKELCDISGEESLPRAISALGLAPEGSGPYSLTVVEDWHGDCAERVIDNWHHAGAESWVYVFDLSTRSQSRRLVLKSYAPDVAPRPIGEMFAEVLERRVFLAAAGARTPHLYGHHNATVLEDFIPYTLAEVLQSSDLKRNTRQIVEDVLSMAQALENLRFDAIAWIEGLLSDGEYAYMVDFGTDLGAPYTRTSRSHINQAETFLRKRLSPSERSLLTNK
jgi:hypothetical protein